MSGKKNKKSKKNTKKSSRRDSLETVTQESYLDSLPSEPHSPESPWSASLSPQPQSKFEDHGDQHHQDKLQASDQPVVSPDGKDFKAIPYSTLLTRQPSLALKYATPSLTKSHVMAQNISSHSHSPSTDKQSSSAAPRSLTSSIASLAEETRRTPTNTGRIAHASTPTLDLTPAQVSLGAAISHPNSVHGSTASQTPPSLAQDKSSLTRHFPRSRKPKKVERLSDVAPRKDEEPEQPATMSNDKGQDLEALRRDIKQRLLKAKAKAIYDLQALERGEIYDADKKGWRPPDEKKIKVSTRLLLMNTSLTRRAEA